jgi:hypothetical protein
MCLSETLIPNAHLVNYRFIRRKRPISSHFNGV